jgi:predicted RNase H-like HicB family nuclease
VFGEEMAATYRVELERDRTGWWVATVPKVAGAHTQGRSIEQAMNRIREALGLWIEDANEAELMPDIHLPASVRSRVDRALVARRRARRMDEEASRATLDAITNLTDHQAMSVRDVATLLELSPARVGQLRPRTARGTAAKAR